MKKIYFLSLVLLNIALADTPSWCNSSNLNKTEHTICANDELIKLDKKLAKVYGSAKASTYSQKKWLKKRNACDGDIECIKKAYLSRIEELKKSINAPSWCNSSHLNKTEHTICANNELSKLDKKLAKVYGLAKASSQNQKEWVAQRDKCGNDIECIKNSYINRIKELEDKKESQNNTSTKILDDLINRKVIIPKGTYIETDEEKMRVSILTLIMHGRDETTWQTLNLVGGMKLKEDLLGIIKKCFQVENMMFCKVGIGNDDYIYVRKKDLHIGAKAY